MILIEINIANIKLYTVLAHSILHNDVLVTCVDLVVTILHYVNKDALRYYSFVHRSTRVKEGLPGNMCPRRVTTLLLCHRMAMWRPTDTATPAIPGMATTTIVTAQTKGRTHLRGTHMCTREVTRRGRETIKLLGISTQVCLTLSNHFITVKFQLW